MRISHLNIFDVNIRLEMTLSQRPKREQTLFKIVGSRIPKVLASFFQKETNYIKKNNIKVLFFGASNNNKRSFETIFNVLDENTFVYIKDNKNYPMIKSIYLSVPYVFVLLRRFINATDKQKNLIIRFPLAYLFAYGKYIIAKRIINNFKPKILVLANDHSPMNRCLFLAATELKIKTIYLQHASVTDKFPKLNFDYSFLDGKESFEKYGSISKRGSRVILSGSSRFDKFYNNSRKKDKNKIGIAINQFDDFGIVKKLCLDLKKKSYINIIVRPHPNMINWHKYWFESNNIEYSDASIVPPYTYLNQIFFQISNISGIHLDALILNVPSVLYKLSNKPIEDIFGFLNNGLVKNANNFEELLECLSLGDQLLNKSKIQYYNASSFTALEGHVGEFIGEYINSLVRGYNEEDELEKKYNMELIQF